MKASELIETLTGLVTKHGDLEVVSGLDRTGYGEKVIKVVVARVTNLSGIGFDVIDIIPSDNTAVSTIWSHRGV